MMFLPGSTKLPDLKIIVSGQGLCPTAPSTCMATCPMPELPQRHTMPWLEQRWPGCEGAVPQMMSGRNWFIYRGNDESAHIADIKGPGKTAPSNAPPQASVFFKGNTR